MTDTDNFFPVEQVNFSGFSKDIDLSRADIEGEKLWNLIFQRDLNFGGMLTGIFGIMGSGKTSMLHHITRRIMKENPNELVFWREPLNNPLQVHNNGCNFQILCEKRHPVTVKILSDHGLIQTDDIPVRLFSGFKDLLKKAETGLINVVYLDDLSRWIRLIDVLKLTYGWKTCIFDEMEDVTPMRVSGKSWTLNEQFANSLKEIRKSYISIVYNTQSQMDLDYRISSKTMMHCYLYGSRKDEHSPIFKGTLQALELGSAWLDLARARFGLIKFDPVLPQQPTYYVVPDRRRKDKKEERSSFDELSQQEV